MVGLKLFKRLGFGVPPSRSRNRPTWGNRILVNDEDMPRWGGDGGGGGGGGWALWWGGGLTFLTPLEALLHFILYTSCLI